MVNMLVIAAVFILLLLLIAGFVSQQFSTALKIKENQRPKNLLEKMNSGIGALDTAKFRQIVIDSGPDESGVLTDTLLDQDSPGAGIPSGETPDDMVINEQLGSAGSLLNLEGKDLQTIYSEYLSEKSVNPFDLEPEFRLGVAYLRFSQFEKAIIQFQKVTDKKPEYPGIFYYLGEAYRCNGQFYEAMKAYKQSWEMDSRIDKSDETQPLALENSGENPAELQL